MKRGILILSAFILLAGCSGRAGEGSPIEEDLLPVGEEASIAEEESSEPEEESVVPEKSQEEPEPRDRFDVIQSFHGNRRNAYEPMPENLTLPALLWPVKGESYVATVMTPYPSPIGLLVGAPPGTEIVAAMDGTVILSQESDTGFGNQILLDHGEDFTTRYAHCDTLLVKEGETVEAGQVIATVGRTGYATGNHLDFQLYYCGDLVCPADYIWIV